MFGISFIRWKNYRYQYCTEVKIEPREGEVDWKRKGFIFH